MTSRTRILIAFALLHLIAMVLTYVTLVWADVALGGVSQLIFSLCVFGLMVWLLNALWKPVLDDMETQSHGS
ncbi:hypothetical protein [Amantichitinum ursilacus]|uniref:Uncharacterized protein n=1 Tax=Amantichitinum ursilacus TaxID=857265 RepID=A0A0N1JSU7_9NEIS|nr:hypothetical protein [Amantichitinum ursilacus]KPC53001.1 hypothetical protein WG78_10940 [Amantichitinum ursilacus]